MTNSIKILLLANACGLVQTAYAGVRDELPQLYDQYQEEWCLVGAKRAIATTSPTTAASTQDRSLLLEAPAVGDTLFVPGTSGTGVQVSKNSLATKFETNTANSRAAIGLNRVSSSGGGALNSYGLEFSAPVAKSGDTQLAQFGDFSSDAKLSFSFASFGPSWSRSNNSNTPEEAKKKYGSAMLIGLRKHVTKTCKTADLSPTCAQKIVLLDKLTSEDMGLDSGCIDTFAGSAMATAYQNQEFESQAANFFGFATSVGYQSYDFKDPDSFSSMSEDKTPWSAELFFGRYSKNRDTLYRAGYTRVQGFKAVDKSTLCQAADSNGIQQCQTSAFAVPVEDDKDIGFAEIRHRFDGRFIKAASAKISYDFANEEPAIELPLYLLSGADGQLNGGVRASWDEKNNVVAGIFIGSTFSIDPS